MVGHGRGVRRPAEWRLLDLQKTINEHSFSSKCSMRVLIFFMNPFGVAFKRALATVVGESDGEDASQRLEVTLAISGEDPVSFTKARRPGTV